MIPPIRGIVVCVSEHYAKLLALTLPRNMRHLASCMVITTPDDEATKAVVAGIPGAWCFETDAFTRPDRHGVRPRFNKGLAIEEAFCHTGKSGWYLVHDADILFPDSMPLDSLDPECLHGAPRRMIDDPAAWREDLDWKAFPIAKDGIAIGYFQLFYSGAAALKGKPIWYHVGFAHGGGGDAYFVTHWTGIQRCWLATEVLHLGPRDTNWFGTDEDGRELMGAFILRNGWRRSNPINRDCLRRVEEIVDRVEPEGYEIPEYELPFVRRRPRMVSRLRRREDLQKRQERPTE